MIDMTLSVVRLVIRDEGEEGNSSEKIELGGRPESIRND